MPDPDTTITTRMALPGTTATTAATADAETLRKGKINGENIPNRLAVRVFLLIFAHDSNQIGGKSTMQEELNISQTPMAPYLGILNSMDNKEKMTVALFLVSSIPNVEIIQIKEEQSISEEDEAFLAEKLSAMSFSPRIDRLFQKRKEIAQTIDTNDERTRHILGL